MHQMVRRDFLSGGGVFVAHFKRSEHTQFLCESVKLVGLFVAVITLRPRSSRKTIFGFDKLNIQNPHGVLLLIRVVKSRDQVIDFTTLGYAAHSCMNSEFMYTIWVCNQA